MLKSKGKHLESHESQLKWNEPGIFTWKRDLNLQKSFIMKELERNFSAIHPKDNEEKLRWLCQIFILGFFFLLLGKYQIMFNVNKDARKWIKSIEENRMEKYEKAFEHKNIHKHTRRRLGIQWSENSIIMMSLILVSLLLSIHFYILSQNESIIRSVRRINGTKKELADVKWCIDNKSKDFVTSKHLWFHSIIIMIEMLYICQNIPDLFIQFLLFFLSHFLWDYGTVLLMKAI